MSMIKKLVLAGIAGAVISLGIAGIGTASADGGHNDWHNNPCIVDGTAAINPACWQGVIWGGVANGWVPQYGYYNSVLGFWQTYYLLNFYQNNWYYWNYQYCWNNPSMGYWNNGVWYPFVNSGYWSNGVWYGCGNGYWSNGIWYPY